MNNGKRIGYALGLEIGTYRGRPIVEHDGALFGYRTGILRFPEQRFTVVCLCNLSSADPADLSRKIADVYLEKDLGPATVSLPPAVAASGSDPGPLAGKYRDSRNHSVFSFVAVGGNLTGRGTILKPDGPNRFEEPGGAIVAFSGSDGAMKATIDYDNEIWFTGTRIQALHLSEAVLAAYVGAYTSAELNVTYRLSVDKGNLVLRTNWNPPLSLDPIAPDEFDAAGEMTLVFRRDAHDRVSALSVFADRIRNVSFEKVN